MKLEPYVSSYWKIKSKWIKDIDVIPGMQNSLEENIGVEKTFQKRTTSAQELRTDLTSAT